jgi:hypothetical protein
MSPTAAELEARELEAFLIAISGSVVAIIGKQNGEFGKAVGTGTLVRVGEKPFLVTAAHVIEDCTPDELRFLMPDETLIQDREPGEKPKLKPTKIFSREPLILRSCKVDQKLDIAAIEMSDIYLGFPNLSFTEIVPAPKIPPEGSDTVMMGFPSERAQPLAGNYVVFRYVEYPRVVDPGGHIYKDFDPGTQFLLDYPASEDYDPAGFSGSALWGRKEEAGLWQPNPRIVGMVLGYYRRLKRLYAVSAPTIASFLEAG